MKWNINVSKSDSSIPLFNFLFEKARMHKATVLHTDCSMMFVSRKSTLWDSVAS